MNQRVKPIKYKAGPGVSAVPVRDDKMPAVVYAVVRQVRSRLCGVMQVMLRWFTTPEKAARFARRVSCVCGCQVCEWRQSGDGSKGRDRLTQRVLLVVKKRDTRVGRGRSRKRVAA